MKNLTKLGLACCVASWVLLPLIFHLLFQSLDLWSIKVSHAIQADLKAAHSGASEESSGTVNSVREMGNLYRHQYEKGVVVCWLFLSSGIGLILYSTRKSKA